MKNIQAANTSDYPTDITGLDLGGGKRGLHVAGKELVIGVDYDTLDVTYPTTTTEQYSYKLNAVEVFLIEVTYVASDKEQLLKVEVL
jgi:hypothetical protein